MTKKYSSFAQQQLLTEAWRQYAENGELDEGFMDKLKGLNPFSKMRQRTGTPDQDDDDTPTGELMPGDDPTAPAPEPAAEPAAAEPAAATAAEPAGMPISGTEFATMNILAGGKLLDIIKKAVNVGAAAKDGDSRNLQQLFNKEFFPALVKMTKNPNIDIAEGIDMEQFLQEMITEAEGPLSKGQQAYRKGKARQRGGMKNYLKSAGGKPPIIANKITRDLTKALTQGADANTLGSAFQKVAATIKDAKGKKDYIKRYGKIFAEKPEERVANYKQNVAAFVGAVSDLATAAAAKALSAGGNFAADKAADTAAQRAPAPEPAAAPVEEPPSTMRRSNSASRMRSRDRSAARGPFGGVTEQKKTFKIHEDGSVSRINNEKK